MVDARAAIAETDIEALDDVERQTAFRVNERTHHQRRPGHKNGWGISPNIARASPSREKKPPTKVAKPKPAKAVQTEVAPIVQPSIAMAPPPDSLATFNNYESMVEAFRTAKNLRGLSNNHTDELANLATGHSDAILGPTGRKTFGRLSFDALAWAFCVKFVMVPDVEREGEMAVHWADRQRQSPHVREPSRVSKIIIERARPHVLSAIARKGWQTRRLKARKSAQAESNP